jgi:hypothetical protein
MRHYSKQVDSLDAGKLKEVSRAVTEFTDFLRGLFSNLELPTSNF